MAGQLDETKQLFDLRQTKVKHSENTTMVCLRQSHRPFVWFITPTQQIRAANSGEIIEIEDAAPPSSIKEELLHWKFRSPHQPRLKEERVEVRSATACGQVVVLAIGGVLRGEFCVLPR